MPVLEGINLSEGASAMVYGFSSDNDFSVTLSEGSRLEGTIETGDIGFGLSEGSQVNLTGSGNNLVARSSDGSRLMLDDFPIHNADINIDGGGRAILNISGRLDTTLTGGSRLEYSGNPEMERSMSQEALPWSNGNRPAITRREELHTAPYLQRVPLGKVRLDRPVPQEIDGLLVLRVP
jgi:hypothetical protein